jgi:tetratricopeptide (TPR) repeat protein
MASLTADLELGVAALGTGSGLSIRLMEPDIRHGPFPIALEPERLLAYAGDLEQYGAALRDMLFSDPQAREAFLACRAAGLGAGKQLRIRLLLPPELQSLRWEALRDPQSGRVLACEGDLLLSRYLSGDDYTPLALRPKSALKALVAVAAPTDAEAYGLAPIVAEDETARIVAALAELRPTIIAATWAGLSAALREGYDIVYLVAHGMIQGGQPWLYLVDDQGNADRRRGGALADLLRSLKQRGPRVLVLASCESAGDGYADTLAALGPLLAQAGIPAVLAMQGSLSIATNERFAPVLFRELLRDGSIDQAVNAARMAVADRPDWWMPVQYTRLRNGMIWQDTPAPVAATAQARVRQLRAPVADFVGRVPEIAALNAALTSDAGAAVALLSGMGGIGKTELALKAANDLTGRYPDGQIVMHLQGSHGSPLSAIQALQQVILAFQPEARLPDDEQGLTEIYRSLLSEQHAIIIADDAKDAAQVAPLLPPQGSALLITSRLRFRLAGAQRIDLGILGEAEAIAFLQRLCNRLDPAEARQIGESCGWLPLALRSAGRVLDNNATLSVTRYLERLSDGKRRLSALRDPDDPELDVAVSIALSYELLPAEAQETLQYLSVFEDSFDRYSAQDVLDESDEDRLETLLGQLYRSTLIEYSEERYDLQGLVRSFALDRLAEQADAERRARLRHARHFIEVAAYADQLYLAGGDDILAGLALFDAERANLDAARRWLQTHAGDAAVDELLVAEADATVHIGNLRYQIQSERIPQIEAALAAARRLDLRAMIGVMCCNLGNAYRDLGAAHAAIAFHQQDLAIARELENRSSEGNALGNLGNVHGDLGNPDQAIDYYRQALEIAREQGDHASEQLWLGNLGVAFAGKGDLVQAVDFYGQALELARALGSWARELNVLVNLGDAYTLREEPAQAGECYQQALQIAAALGNQAGEQEILVKLGRAYAGLGHMDEAMSCYQQSLAITRTLEDRQSELHMLDVLGQAHADREEPALTVDCFQQGLALARDLDDREGERHFLGMLGAVYALQGEPNQANDFFQQALAVASRLGDAYIEQGNPVAAADCYRQILAIVRERGDQDSELQVLAILGDVYARMSELGEAVACYEQALAITRERGDRESEQQVLGKLGLVALQSGDARRAVEHYRQALKIAQKLGDRHNEAIFNWNLGQAFVAIGRIGRALPLLEACIAFEREIGQPDLEQSDAIVAYVREHRAWPAPAPVEQSGMLKDADIAALLEAFDPLLQAIAAVALGDRQPRAEVEAVLAEREAAGWMLRGPVARIWAGERDGAALSEGLDAQDTALVARMLELIEFHQEQSDQVGRRDRNT